MESNKRPDKLSDEELIKLLNNPDLQDEISLSSLSENSIVKFIDTFQLSAGSETISIRLLYGLYKEVIKEALNADDFKTQINKIFRVDKNHNVHLNLEKSKINQYIIQILDKKPPEKHQGKVLTEVKKFLKQNEIESGDYYFEDFVLYSLYEDLLTFDNFQKLLKNFLPYKFDKHGVYWFGISHDLNKFITHEELNKLRTAGKLNGKEKKEIKKK